MIMSQRRKHVNSEGIERLNKFVSDIKGVGLIEGMTLNGRKGRYFLIDGHSWENACRRLERPVAATFIAWDEADFFEFLKSQFVSQGKPQADTKLARRGHK